MSRGGAALLWSWFSPRLYAFGGRNHESGPLDNVGGLAASATLVVDLEPSHVKLSCYPDFLSENGDESHLDGEYGRWMKMVAHGGSYSKFMV